MALGQKTKDLIAAIGMSKEGFKARMERRGKITEKAKEMETFREKETFKAGLKDPKQTPEEKYAEFQKKERFKSSLKGSKDPEAEFQKFKRKEEFKQQLESETDQAKLYGLSVQEYRLVAQKAGEQNMEVPDYLDALQSEQEAALKSEKLKQRTEGMKKFGVEALGTTFPAVGAMQKLGQRYFGKQQPASTQASKEPTAINRKTGERLVYRGGKWQPLK